MSATIVHVNRVSCHVAPLCNLFQGEEFFSSKLFHKLTFFRSFILNAENVTVLLSKINISTSGISLVSHVFKIVAQSDQSIVLIVHNQKGF